MKKILNLLFYYCLLLIGLSATSWIIYARFIRERTIRDIPDALFTEFRFWILLYICCIYLYTVKSLLMKNEGNIVINELVTLAYKPIIMLDHSLKYNTIIKPYYVKFMMSFVILLGKLSLEPWYKIIFMMQIFPRFVLVTFLLVDTFYFCRIELFYTVILIGLLPFILRYIKYSLKDFHEHLLLDLEQKYSFISVYEEGFEPWGDWDWDNERKLAPTAPYHNTDKNIIEFLEILFENRYMDKVDYWYVFIPFCKPEVYKQYMIDKYKPDSVPFFAVDVYELVESEDKTILNKLFHDTLPVIMEQKLQLLQWECISERKSIHWSRIVIFSLYFICWSYILATSYWHYPVELIMGKYYIVNFLMYLTTFDNPFAEIYWGSSNTNMLTPESMKVIFEMIVTKIKSKFL